MATLGGSLAAPHPDDCHDATCAAVAVAHDASAHQIRAARSDAESHPLHCLVCHWARSFRPRTEARVLPTPAHQPATRVHVDVFTFSSATQAAQPPLRSPPASSDLASTLFL
ncbi:MAG: hypothetical protein HY657_07255 [Acidobacteria bacterium]|nr:hypothetical protein [Acidobacteriota bacterium]